MSTQTNPETTVVMTPETEKRINNLMKKTKTQLCNIIIKVDNEQDATQKELNGLRLDFQKCKSMNDRQAKTISELRKDKEGLQRDIEGMNLDKEELERKVSNRGITNIIFGVITIVVVICALYLL